MSELVIGGRTFRSRLFVGTGKFSSNELMARAIAASESEMVTVAMKRIDMNNPQVDMLGQKLPQPRTNDGVVINDADSDHGKNAF